MSTRRPHTVLELAEREAVDLIVACAHGATGDANDRYGSTAAHLIRWSNRPIVVLQDLAGVVHESTRAGEAARTHPGH